MSDKKVNFNVQNNYGISYEGYKSDFGFTGIKTTLNNFKTKNNDIEELDLNLDNDVKAIENSTSDWLSSAKDCLEQLRMANNEEIEKLETENASLEKKYQSFLKTIPSNSERDQLIKELEEQLNVLNENSKYYYRIGPDEEKLKLEGQLSKLQKEKEAEQLKYIEEHPDEFKSFMGMSFEEYNQKLATNETAILEFKAKDYQLRQQAKEMPYLEIMMTEDFQNYMLNYNGDNLQFMGKSIIKDEVEYLTDDQILMFSYLYEKKGIKEANAYLEAIEDKINQAKGMAEARLFLSRITDEEGNVDVGALEYTLLTVGQGMWNGIENFGEGFENLFDITSDGMITDNQYAQQFILQGLSELQESGQVSDFVDDTYQISTSIGNMLPGSLISILTGGTGGYILMGMSAAGNAKNQALVSMSDNKALAYLYGAFNGASEAVVGKLLGNIPGLNEGAKFAAKEILSEGVEEFTQTFVDAGLKAVIFGETPELGSLTEEAIQSFIYGCITSGIMTGSQTAINFTVNGVKYTYGNINEMINAYNDGKITSIDTNTTTDIKNKVDRYNQLMETINSEGYQNWYFDNFGAGEIHAPEDTSSQFYHIKQEYEVLNREIIQLAKQKGISKAELLSSNNGDNSYKMQNDSSVATSNINTQNSSASYETFKKQILQGISAMNSKYCTIPDIGMRNLKKYLDTGDSLCLSSAGNFRKNATSMPRDILIKIYNETITERNAKRTNTSKQSVIESDIISIIEKHDQKYNLGLLEYNAVESLLKFINPNDKNYGRFAVISSNAGGRSILKKYTPSQIALGLSSLGYYIENVSIDNSSLKSTNLKQMSEWYDANSSSKYGVDQGAIEDLCVYKLNGEKYNYRDARKIVNEAMKNGMPIPKFCKLGSQEYMNLKDKLTNMGFSKGDASIILSSVNDAGACSYASLANEIFFSFRNNIDLFEKKFGYSYYKNGDINSGVNDTELLLDLYLFANDIKNGGRFIVGNRLINIGNTIDVFGRNILDSEEQVFMSIGNVGRKNEIIDRFLKSKDINFGYSSSTINNWDCAYYNDYQFEKLKQELTKYVVDGYTLSMDYFYLPKYNDKIIRMKNIDGRGRDYTTADWLEGFGHSVTITGMNNEGFIISSWGAKYVIPFDDLKNGGRFNINISKIDLT